MQNPKEVLNILSSQNGERYDRKINDAMLSLIAGDWSPSGISVLLTLYLDDGRKSDEYWTPAIEAYIVAHFDRAHRIFSELRQELHRNRFDVLNRLYPAAITAALKTTIWKIDPANQIFSGHVTQGVAVMLLNYTEGSSSRNAKEPGTWILGQFTSAFNDHFNKQYPDDFWEKLSDFIDPLLGTNYIGTHSEKFMDEVAQRLLYLMPRPMRIRSLANAWNDAKKLNTANQSREFWPTADAAEQVARAGLP